MGVDVGVDVDGDGDGDGDGVLPLTSTAIATNSIEHRYTSNVWKLSIIEYRTPTTDVAHVTPRRVAVAVAVAVAVYAHVYAHVNVTSALTCGESGPRCTLGCNTTEMVT